MGCVEIRQVGSHLRVECGACVTTVPVHAGQEIGPGLLRAIERDLGPCLGRGWLRKGCLVTAAAHSRLALVQAKRAGAHAALLAPVFATASHPDRLSLGALRFAALARTSPLPVYALGGIGAAGARRLLAARIAGIAGIGGFSTPGNALANKKSRGRPGKPPLVRESSLV